MARKILLFVAVALGYYQWSYGSLIGLESPLTNAAAFSQTGPGIDEPPLQRALRSSGLAFTFENYTIQPLASIQGKARVLSARRYRLGREADLSPVDLALGWGPMADETVLRDIDIRQSSRFFFWRAEQLPIPRKAIETNSANVHMIPANPEVDKQLRRVEAGDVIRFRGYLVRIDASDGWQWTSSMTRDDTGNGACELVLLEAID